MKTQLPESINTVQEAEAFLDSLIQNNEIYHPEDDAFDVVWRTCAEPTSEEKEQLNKLMSQVCDFGDFDPCMYIIAGE